MTITEAIDYYNNYASLPESVDTNGLVFTSLTSKLQQLLENIKDIAFQEKLKIIFLINHRMF
jgi:hypothetical protein